MSQTQRSKQLDFTSLTSYRKLPVAFSPCPNDTFLFHAWIAGHVGKTCPLEPTFADISQLNQWAAEKKFPLMKVSFACFRELLAEYELLPVGAALGRGCGPKIIAKHPFPLEELSSKCIAIPGPKTTAHLLLQTLAPRAREKVFCLYHEISSLIHQGIAECGLIIHESRFTFEKEGFVEIADLGVLWENTFQLPLPLGGIVVRKDLPRDDIHQLTSHLQASLTFAWNHPEASREFVTFHSQEKNWDVIAQHIRLYVNEETYFLSSLGRKAVDTLLSCGISS